MNKSTYLIDYLEQVLGKRNSSYFIKWAFGLTKDDLKKEPIGLQLMYKWNKRHGDTLQVSPFGSFYLDLEKMIDLYEKKNLVRKSNKDSLRT